VHGQIDEAAHGRAEGELARVLYWAGKIDEAGPLALKSLPHNQDDPRVWLIAGVYLHRLGKTDDALHYLRHAIRMSPHDERIREALEAIEVVDREQPRDEARQRDAG
jgi:tetratricopeptide (TPR) repeat protein